MKPAFADAEGKVDPGVVASGQEEVDLDPPAEPLVETSYEDDGAAGDEPVVGFESGGNDQSTNRPVSGIDSWSHVHEIGNGSGHGLNGSVLTNNFDGPENNFATPSSVASVVPAHETISSEISGTNVKPARIGVVVLDVSAGISPEPLLNSIGDNIPIVFVTDKIGGANAVLAAQLGAEVVNLGGGSLGPGRIRNTGYRRLKAIDPEVEFVQFLEADFQLDPNWFEAAAAFMRRRPEVSIIDGHQSVRLSDKSVLNRIAEISREKATGELQVLGGSAFMRAAAFEEVGGFRGDIAANDTEDLCLRLRRRGHHIWCIDDAMGQINLPQLRLKDWWANAKRCGYEYAHGKSLHGSPPERFRVLEHARALIWGGIFPAMIIFSAIIFAVATKFLSPLANPVATFGWIMGFGSLIYLVKLLVIAIRHGFFSLSSWAYGLITIAGHFGEFIGVMNYYLSSRSRQRS